MKDYRVNKNTSKYDLCVKGSTLTLVFFSRKIFELLIFTSNMTFFFTYARIQDLYIHNKFLKLVALDIIAALVFFQVKHKRFKCFTGARSQWQAGISELILAHPHVNDLISTGGHGVSCLSLVPEELELHMIFIR